MTEERIPERQSRVIIDRAADAASDETQTLTLEPNSHLLYCFAVFSGQIRRRLTINLEDGAEARVVGFFVGSGNDQYRLHVTMHHLGRGTTGLTNLRGALGGSAVADATGLIDIPASGQGANAFFEARTLLLSRTAKSESLPSLEIAANDVKAGHASTTSGLDATNLFYLMSRGLPKLLSARMLVEGLLGAPLRLLPEAERVSLLGHLHAAVASLSLADA